MGNEKWFVVYRSGQLILRRIDANDDKFKNDAGAEMLTDVTPVGRVAGQLYTGQNVSCLLHYDRLTQRYIETVWGSSLLR